MQDTRSGRWNGSRPLHEEVEDDSASQAAALARATLNAALECTAELVTRCPPNCLEAVRNNIIPLLTSYVSSHRSPPPNPAALRCLYQLVTCAPHRAEIYDGIMSCLTIPALTHLLDASLVHAGPEHCGALPTMEDRAHVLFHSIACTSMHAQACTAHQPVSHAE